MALRSTQPLTEISTRSISVGDKRGRCIRLKILPPSCAVVMKCGSSNFLEPSGALQASNGTVLPLCKGLHSAVLCPLPSRLLQIFWHSASFCVKNWAAAVAYPGILFGRDSNSFQDRGQFLTFTFVLYKEWYNSCSAFAPARRKLWWIVGFEAILSISLSGLSYYKIIYKFDENLTHWMCRKINTLVLISL